MGYVYRQMENKSPIPKPSPPVPDPNQIYPQPTQPSQQGVAPNYSSNTIPQNGFLTGSQMPPEKKSRKKFFTIVALVAIAGTAVIAALIYVNIIPLNKFKTVIYDNGKGNTYSLKFYSRYLIKNVNESTRTGTEPDTSNSISPGLEELVSKVWVNGKYPLVLWLESNPSTNQNDKAFIKDDCSLHNLKKAFEAHINYIERDVGVCSIAGDVEGKGSSVDIIYLVTFHDTQKNHIAYFAQDADYKKILSSQSEAAKSLPKFDLSVYEDDVKTILSSVKPL